VSVFCRLFGYSKQAYFKQRSHRYREPVVATGKIREEVLNLRRSMPRLGTRKLHHVLKADIKMGRDKLFAVLREEGLLVVRKKRFIVTTNSHHWMRKYPNLVRDMTLTRPEQLWVSDITYIPTADGHSYLHLVTDAYSKRIMGYELSSNMEAATTLKALKMAIGNRIYQEPLIHHSDRGLQYCSKVYVEELNRQNILISMTENGDPYENAVAERVNGILKSEFGMGEQFCTIAQADKQVRQSIHIYNILRPHLSCQMLTPKQMHNQRSIQIKTYKRKDKQHQNAST